MNKTLLTIFLIALFFILGPAIDLPAGVSATITARATVADPIGFTRGQIDTITADEFEKIIIPGITVPRRGSVRCEVKLGRYTIKEMILYHQDYLQTIYLENMRPSNAGESSDTLLINIIYFENR